MALIAEPAPTFSLEAVSAACPTPQVVSLGDYAGQWLLLLFYPRDFSFVCPTELTSFSARAGEFAQRKCRLLGLSVDSIASHQEWLATPPDAGGVGPLQYPLASDPGGDVARRYGVWLPTTEVCARGLFLIDPQGIVQYSVVHNLFVGRSVDEILRVLDALESGGLCPANWTAADGTLDMNQALQPGRVLGHYRIRELLGTGGFGMVFAAWDLRLERDVALKILRYSTPETRTDVLREARVAAPLSHPNICSIYAIEEIDGIPVIALEHIEGQTLYQMIKAGLDERTACKLALGIARGLAAAHARRIVHGDLKPRNVLVDRQQVPRILDFGFACSDVASPAQTTARPPIEQPEIPMPENATPADDTVIMAGDPPPPADPPEPVLRGTPAYMAPEQWDGVPATPASDMFTFGLMFFEMLTGRRALPSGRVWEFRTFVRNPQLAVELCAVVPACYRELLTALLASDPRQRLTSAELVRRLEAVLV